MTDKEILTAVRAEIERLKEMAYDHCGEYWDGCRVALNAIFSFIDSLQKDPVIKETNMYIFITQKIVDYIEEHKVFFENTIPTIGEKWFIEREHTYPNVNRGNPVVEVINDKGEWMRLPKDIVEIFEEPKDRCKDCNNVKGESTDEILTEIRDKELEEAASSFARKDSEGISNPANFYYTVADKMRIFKAGAQWQKEKDKETIELAEDHAMLAGMEKMKEQMMKNIWKPADGDNLPEINREVIALLDNGKVVFAHRPPEYWDGKNIITGKVTRNYPQTYNKGGWNIPDVKFWLDCSMPKETKDE